LNIKPYPDKLLLHQQPVKFPQTIADDKDHNYSTWKLVPYGHFH